jgi:GntR family transcriptional regulator, transcriptional repressor for pyruvate dehydrogenase complex
MAKRANQGARVTTRDVAASRETATRPKKRSGAVIDRIIASLASGLRKPGERLPSIEALAVEYSVGRTSVREALMALELVGVVELRHGDGTFIREGASRFCLRPLSWSALLDKSKIAALAETRRCMESELAAMAAQRATAEEIAEIEQHLLRMEAVCRRPDQYIRVDPQFHLAVWRAARNEVMLNMLTSIMDLLKTVISTAVSNAPDSIAVGLQAHREIFESIAARDVEAARFSMRRHLDSVARLALASSGAASGPDGSR